MGKSGLEVTKLNTNLKIDVYMAAGTTQCCCFVASVVIDVRYIESEPGSTWASVLRHSEGWD